MLIAVALVLVVVQPRLDRDARRTRPHRSAEHGAVLRAAISASGVYGGYFGAGQGDPPGRASSASASRDDLQRLNALKNVLAGTVNLTAGLIFVFAAEIDWAVAGLIADRLDRRRRPGRDATGAGCRRRCCGSLIVIFGIVAIAQADARLIARASRSAAPKLRIPAITASRGSESRQLAITA